MNLQLLMYRTTRGLADERKTNARCVPCTVYVTILESKIPTDLRTDLG